MAASEGAKVAVGQSSAEGTPSVSISPFPFDITPAAVETVSRIIRENANLYTVQLDNGIPWKAALENKAFSKQLKEQWERHKNAIGTKPVYLAIAPLAEDRTSWAPGFEREEAPNWARNEKAATAELKRAYSQFVLRAVEYFQPTYLNIGVEAGDMAARKPGKWPVFEELFSDCAAEVRKKHPNVKLGISFSLPLLMKGGVLNRAKNVIGTSDYVGISFYPYLSDFYKKLGGVALPDPPQQWRQPLGWLRQNIRKPVAICETGYSSKPVSLPSYGLKMDANETLQRDYVAELADIARSDRFLFTVFFLSVDCEPLMKRLGMSDGALWTYTGFFDQELREKPAWKAYQSAWLRKDTSTGLGSSKSEATAAPEPKEGSDLGKELFQAPPPDKVTSEKSAERGAWIRWEYAFRPKEFSWALKPVEAGSAAGSQGIEFDARSDRQDALLFQVEQDNGRGFFQVVTPSKEWKHHALRWSGFTPDPSKPQGKLEPERIARVMLADPTAKDKAVSGRRTVEISKLSYIGK